MKPLEHRRWFVVMTLVVAFAATAALWRFAGLPWRLSSGSIFLFATVGAWTAVNTLLALVAIRWFPSLGAV